MKFSVVNYKEDDMIIAFCPEIDVASQGYNLEEANSNLKEAIELFFEFASDNEKLTRINQNLSVSILEVDFA